jgi:tripartite-type tricarboxylate transporter receptor subunit TctC
VPRPIRRGSVRIIVPNEPGGIYDLVARLMATELSKRLPQRFYVENKPGAGSILGTQAAAKAAPDGYTLLMGGLSNIVFNAALYRLALLLRFIRYLVADALTRH